MNVIFEGDLALVMYLGHAKVGGHTANTKKFRTLNASLISVKSFSRKNQVNLSGIGEKILEVGGVKFSIFMLTYNTQF